MDARAPNRNIRIRFCIFLHLSLLLLFGSGSAQRYPTAIETRLFFVLPFLPLFFYFFQKHSCQPTNPHSGPAQISSTTTIIIIIVSHHQRARFNEKKNTSVKEENKRQL